jgi:adenine-specific DNA-methyltransferase
VVDNHLFFHFPSSENNTDDHNHNHNIRENSLCKVLASSATNNNDIILDFFAGSGTTGHAVMQLNLEEKKQAIDNGEDPTLVGNRKYIMVQLPELIGEKTDAYKAGYKKISDITIDRIKRVGTKISEENTDVKLDVGFKVFETTPPPQYTGHAF